MIFIQKVEYLFEYFDVFDWTLSNDKLFGVEIDIFFRWNHASSPVVSFIAFVHTVSSPEAFTMASSHFAIKWPTHAFDICLLKKKWI